MRPSCAAALFAAEIAVLAVMEMGAGLAVASAVFLRAVWPMFLVGLGKCVFTAVWVAAVGLGAVVVSVFARGSGRTFSDADVGAEG